MTTQSKDGRAVPPEAGSRKELLQRAIRLKRAAARSRSPQLPARPAGEAARLGELQRSLWLLHQLDPASPAYNLASAFRVTGVLDAGKLERGLDRVVSRHRLLRSTFRPQRDGVRQIIHPHGALRVRSEQLAAGPGEALGAAVREARKPFDLETGPLIRLLLIEEPSRERLLVLILHHILADERSLGVLWRELAEGYAGRPPGDVEQRPQYDDYVHWLSGRDPKDRTADLGYWRRRLDPLPDDLTLPFERPAGEPGGARGRLLSRPLDPEVRHRVRRLAAATGTTPFAVLAFAFRLLLHRITNGGDVAFATPASRRSHPATAEMVGYFLNPVVIRLPVDEQRSVEDAISDFGRQLLDALGHASVPFDLLLEALAPPRRQDRHPIFQTMFVYQEAPPPPELGGLRLEPVTLDLGESKFDLTLFASDGDASKDERMLEIAVEYRADRFDEVSIRQLLGHYETLVRQLADVGAHGMRPRLERPIAAVPMLRPEENDRLRAFARGAPAAADVLAGPLLPRQIQVQARRAPRAPAVIGAEGTWSYAELERAARRIARELATRGVVAGDRVGLFLDRSPLLIAGLLGCHWAGAAYVPLDPAYPSARNLEVLEDAEVAAVLTGSRQTGSRQTGSRQTGSALLDRLAAGASPVIVVDDLASDAIDLDGSGGWALPDLGAEHPAYVLYTSGSTGRPKGVVVAHGGLRASNGARLQVYDTVPRRFLLVPSVAFDSSVAGIFWTLAAGGTLVVPTDDEARDPRQLARLVVEQQVTSLLCVPSLYVHILAHLPPPGDDRGQELETAIVAGESCPPQLVAEHFRRLPRTRLFNEYGPTEATVWASVHEIEPADADRPVCRDPVAIGRPIPGVRLEVLDALGRRVPAGIPGQGWISGPTVAQGYWRRPDLTDERFVMRSIDADRGSVREQRMYATGDRLAWTADGRLLFLGRVDEQIKLRGFRIEPGEIEAALLELPEVRGAAVVARDREQLVAFVEATSVLAGWREDLAKRLPEYMVPSRIVELPELPRLPNGKVDRGRLREIELGPEAAAGDAPGVLDDRQQALISLWQGLLGRTGISPTDNFFQLGGHSLLAAQMTSAIERDFGVALAPAEVFQNPTVRQLAECIERRGGPGTPAYAHLFPIQPTGRGAPFIFCVPHFFTEMAATRFRGERPVYGLRGVSLRPQGNRGRWPAMRDLGEELVEEISRRFPGESCIIAGYSFGATMAVEAVRLMEERGIPVKRLILIAPMPVDFFSLGPFRVQLDGLRQPVDELTFSQALGRLARGNHPLRRRPYQRAWRLLAIQPWRRLLCLAGKLRQRAGLPLTPAILHADVRLERFRLHAGYRPGTLRTPTVIFNAREPETDAAATWRPFFGGPFTVHQTPDPHLGEASAQAARELILDHLREMD